jgi:hypothetical protein
LVPELLRVAHSRAYLRVADGEVRVVRIINSVLVSRRSWTVGWKALAIKTFSLT